MSQQEQQRQHLAFALPCPLLLGWAFVVHAQVGPSVWFSTELTQEVVYIRDNRVLRASLE